MEQKQLDELDESYFGDEFIDDDDSVIISPVKEDKATAKNSKETKAKSAKKAESKTDNKTEIKEKKTRKASTRKTAVKKADKAEAKLEKQAKDDDVKEVKTETAKPEAKTEVAAEAKTEEKPKSTVSTAAPINPWDEEDEADSGLFKEVSTWKAISGIVVILLIFSVFTQGFNFGDSQSVTGAITGDQLSLSAAEEKALAFVNANLLQPPFQAELISSADSGNVYKVELLVAGQAVNSYITKDGSLFFPQGIDTVAVLEQPTEQQMEGTESMEETEVVENTENTEAMMEETEKTETEAMEETQQEEVNIEDFTETEETTEETAPVEQTETVETTPEVSGPVKEVSLVAKKWSFTPDTLSVNAGDKVKLTIQPDTSNPSFALNQFTFAVPELAVQQQVNGPTTVEFTVSEAGNYAFTCSSCEEWRGMSGSLVVR